MKLVLVLLGVVLIALGVLGLVYGEFTYTAESHEADLKIAKLEFKEQERVEVPTWAGVIAVGAGALLLFAGARRRR